MRVVVLCEWASAEKAKQTKFSLVVHEQRYPVWEFSLPLLFRSNPTEKSLFLSSTLCDEVELHSINLAIPIHFTWIVYLEADFPLKFHIGAVESEPFLRKRSRIIHVQQSERSLVHL
mmetsp:Transcript_3433/g.13060  ORF Transcript_3433/g.13060 Transcript_3433/m.13060 type:complete len:117 (-) Transcript_3433:1844-2194(-)